VKYFCTISGYWRGTGVYKKIPLEDSNKDLDSQNASGDQDDSSKAETKLLDDTDDKIDPACSSDKADVVSNDLIERRHETKCTSDNFSVSTTFTDRIEYKRTEKVLTLESSEAENTLNENKAERLQSLGGSGDGGRFNNLDLKLNEELPAVNNFLPDEEGNSEDESPLTTEPSIENTGGASWDIDFNEGKLPGGKTSSRLEALKRARTQHSGEKYVPPKVLVSANQIAQRKVLDLKRWYVRCA
jgi:hypothetical protein